MRFTATTTGGQRFDLELENPRGHSRNPMNDDETSDKLRSMAEAVLPGGETEALLAWLWQIGRASGVDELFERLATARLEM